MIHVRYRHDQQAGRAFSLVELVIVIIIVGMLSAIVVPRYARSLEIHRANTAAERVMHDLNLARELAQAQSASVTVTFNTTSDTYSISGQSSLDNVHQNHTVDLSGSPFDADLTSAVFDDDAIVIFDGYGVPDTGGKVIIQAGRQVVAIELDANTGRATITSSGGT